MALLQSKLIWLIAVLLGTPTAMAWPARWHSLNAKRLLLLCSCTSQYMEFNKPLYVIDYLVPDILLQQQKMLKQCPTYPHPGLAVPLVFAST